MDTSTVTAVNDALSGLVGDVTGLITHNIPIVLGFVGLTVGVPAAIKFAKKFLK